MQASKITNSRGIDAYTGNLAMKIQVRERRVSEGRA